MEKTKKLLELRKKARKSKPNFVVKESKFSARVKSRWRFPRGKHSAVRQMHKGRPALASVGYGAPKAVRGLDKSGLQKVVVGNVKQLSLLNKTTQGAVISGSVGNKNRLAILELAKKEKIAVLNVKDIDKLTAKITDNFNARKKLKEEKLKQKDKKKAEKEKKAEEKKKKEAEAKKTASSETSKVSEESSKSEKVKTEDEKELIKKIETSQ